MRSVRSMVVAAILLACVLALPFAAEIPRLEIPLMVVIVAAFMILGGMLMRSQTTRRYHDPYDLELLKEVHERAQLDEAENVEIPEDADVVCPHCGSVYGSKFKICPECKRMP